MKILAIDTATEACSVALGIDDQTFRRFEVCPQQHSQKLLPMVDEALKEAGIRLKDLDYLAFGRGPGSFTGVRIATGMLQGLALGTELPVVGVSTLAAMAQQAVTEHSAQSVAVAIDARMDEVYFAQFDTVDGNAILAGEEAVLPPGDAVQLLRAETTMLAGTGWDAYPTLLGAVNNAEKSSILYPDALHMLPLARVAIARGEATDIDNIQPVYLRDKVTWKKLPGR